MLASRTALFAVFQGVFALIFAALGSSAPWQESIAWWPWAATFSNVVCILLLRRLVRAEGLRLADLYRGKAHSLWRELPVVLVSMLLVVPLAMLPNTSLAALIFGDTQAPVQMMFRPLLLWAVYPVMLLFPLTIGLAELPTSMGYVMPRVEALSGKGWLAVLLPTLALAAQHIALPLIFDGRYLAWRLLMFLPFALYIAVLLRWRPRLLPYWMVCHALIDLGTAATVLMASQGML